MIASFNGVIVFLIRALVGKIFRTGFFLIGINVNCKVLRKVIVPHFDVCS